MSERYLAIERRYEHDLRAWIAWAEGDAERALSEMREQPAGTCAKCRSIDFASLFERSGSQTPRSPATASTSRLRTTSTCGSMRTGSLRRTSAFGQLYDERGDLENAALHYAQFVELWADADPVLQPRVVAARARLEEIVRERG